MEEFAEKLVAHVGIDRATADKVIAFLKDHADDAVKWLSQSGVKDKLPGGLGDKLGGLF
jgi:N-acetylglucosamine kinase-like BadF-type ATPase